MTVSGDRTMDEHLSLNRLPVVQKEIVETYLEERTKNGEKGAPKRTADRLGKKQQQVSAALTDWRNKMKNLKSELTNSIEDVGMMLKDLDYQTEKRSSWIKELEESVAKLKKRQDDIDEITEYLKLQTDCIFVDKDKNEANWRTLMTIKKILTGRDSPMNQLAFHKELRGTIMDMNRIIDSEVKSIKDLMQLHAEFMKIKISDLPPERRDEIILWVRDHWCPSCPGGHLLDDYLDMKLREQEMHDMLKHSDTIVDVEYGDSDDDE